MEQTKNFKNEYKFELSWETYKRLAKITIDKGYSDMTSCLEHIIAEVVLADE